MTSGSSPNNAIASDGTHLSDLPASASPDDVLTSVLTPDQTAPSRRYVLNSFHARGGMGEVWRCHDGVLRREVALKRLVLTADAARDRFLCEAQITGQLEHPGIVPVHDLGFDDRGCPFYIMKLVRGRSLKEAIDEIHAGGADAGREPRALQRARLLKIFLDLCHAVAYAHSRGVIHRDLKPDNVMLGTFGETIVLDWGLAKFAAQPEAPGGGPSHTDPAGSGRSTQTQDGSVLGSPHYMPPEMARGHTADADQRTDVYLLGATLYEMLTGRPPREGASRDEILRIARTSPPVPPRKLVSDIPRPLEAICLKAMSRSREGRYEPALALAEDVQRHLAGEPVGAYAEPFWTRAARFIHRHRRVAARAAAAVAIVVCAAVGFTYQRRAAGLQAREIARTRVREIRRIIDDASFYAASTDAPSELTPYYDPSRGQDLAGRALSMANAYWGPDAAGLPLAEERAALVEELDFLAKFVSPSAAPATGPTSNAPPHAAARQLFIDAERIRLRSAPGAVLGVDAPSAARREHLATAVSLYQTALERDPTHYWARFQLARCQLALGRTAEAVEALSACVALRPHVPWAYTARGLALALGRRFEEAHRDLDRAQEVAPDFVPSQVTRGVVLRLQNEPARAAQVFDRLLALPQPPPEASFYRAHLHLREGRPDAALAALDRLLADRPGFTPAYLVRAQSLIALNRPDAAARDLDRLAAHPSPAARGHLLRHLIPQLRAEDRKPALAFARAQLTSAAAAPDADATTFADLGAVLHLQGDFTASAGALTRAIERNRNDPQIAINRGWSYEALGRLENARADFSRALALLPTSAEALAGLAYVDARLRRTASAQSGSTLALLHGGGDYLVLHNVACVYPQLATADPANARSHEGAAIALLARALEMWQSSFAGPDERDLIAREVAFTPALRSRPEFQALLRAR